MQKTINPRIFQTILLITLASLFLTACNSGEQPQATARGAYLGGTQGVIANFEPFGVEEDGVYTIFDTETFPLEVTLRNKGEYELQPGDVTVKLLGPSESELNGITTFELQNQDTIEGISDLIPDGSEETIPFASEAEFATPTNGFVDRQWFANIEYRYQTELLIPEVCLKEDLTDDRVCEVTEAKEFFSSGAPITVKSVEESTAGRGIMALQIKIANVANGKVTIPGTEFGTRDTLAYTINDPDWECKAAGQLNQARLVNGEAEIVCKLKSALAEDTIATKQLKLTLDYVYRDLIQETLRIKESQ